MSLITNTATHPNAHQSNRPHLSTPGKHSRREFLRRSALLAGAGVAAPWAVDLAGLAANPVSADDGYRALVCVFLLGGNDHHNTMVPYDQQSYNEYAAVRGSLTRPRNSLLPIGSPNSGNGRSIGFVPELAGLRDLYEAGDLAVLANVGTLVERIDKAAFEDRRKRPPQLFSHNDQQSLWQSSAPEGATTGWGGRLGDLLLADNGQQSTYTCISAGGNAVMLSGREAIQFQVSSRGVIRLDNPFRSAAPIDGLEALMRRSGSTDLFSSAYADLTSRALDTSEFLSGAIADAGGVATEFPDTDLGRQLQTVAELIVAGRDVLGLRRQVFFVAKGGFDNHSDLVDQHSGLLAEIDGAFTAFHRATVELGAADEVTTFSASDFGRTLTSNGDGSDHGWGGHHLVLGGSVVGGKIYGELPTVAVDGPDDVGQGRTIPTTAVDQYSATLASWMGAGGSELDAVVPNLAAFDVGDLGFMAPDPEPDPDTDSDPPGSGPPATGDGARVTEPAVRLSTTET